MGVNFIPLLSPPIPSLNPTPPLSPPVSRELRGSGVRWGMGPSLSVCRDPLWAFCYGAFSESERVGRTLNSAIDGMGGMAQGSMWDRVQSHESVSPLSPPPSPPPPPSIPTSLPLNPDCLGWQCAGGPHRAGLHGGWGDKGGHFRGGH